MPPDPLQKKCLCELLLVAATLIKTHLAETGSCESLSSDNGFLSYPPQTFSQRTQLARFRMNLTEPHVLFVRKPVHVVQALLGKLASRLVSASIRPQQQHGQDEWGPELGVIATASGSHSLSALLYYSNESAWEPGIEAKVSVRAQLDWSTVQSLAERLHQKYIKIGRRERFALKYVRVDVRIKASLVIIQPRLLKEQQEKVLQDPQREAGPHPRSRRFNAADMPDVASRCDTNSATLTLNERQLHAGNSARKSVASFQHSGFWLEDGVVG
ncbi:hypothetical protein MRX96_024524 [Rhipicephalus microplus]